MKVFAVADVDFSRAFMNMRLLLACLLAAANLLGAAQNRPKLVVAIMLDQFRYDYLTRFRTDYSGGFARLLSTGAVFTNARYTHFPTVTAVGHATLLTGALPSVSGIVGNEWFDRAEGKRVSSVSDSDTRLLGANGAGASPRRLLVDTVGDELKLALGGEPRVIGISTKDRSAILPAGHMADGAYWFDSASGKFVSSTYYFADLPAWVKDFNAAAPADRFAGASWLGHQLPQRAGRELYAAVNESPFANELVIALAEAAIKAERLGQRGSTDLLAISLSAHDYVGHDYGPYSPEEREVSIRADRLLESLFQTIDELLGMDNALVVVSSDHGVAPAPEWAAGRKLPAGRIPANAVRDAIQKALTAAYGEGNWVAASTDLQIHLNPELMTKKSLDPSAVRRDAALAALSVEGIARAYTREQILRREMSDDSVSQSLSHSYNERRGPDLVFIPNPYWIVGGNATTHGTPYGYDAHVPVIFMGPGIRPGRYDGAIAINDIAPTLATMLDIETPAGSAGRVLTEMLAP